MNDGAGARALRVAREIERYFGAHPDAADSVEGIRRWWLPFPYNEESIETVQMALTQLEDAGNVRRLTVDGGAVIYGQARGPQGPRRS